MKFPRAMYSLRMSFCVVPRSCLRGHALLLADQLVEQQQHRRRRVDRHRRGHLVERDAVEHAAHVVDRVDRHAGAPHLALAERVVRVAAELGGQVEGHREAGGAVLDQVVEALVGLLRAGVARVLAHRPRAAAVHVRVHAARVGVLAGRAEPLLEAGRHVLVGVGVLDLDARVGEAARIVGPDDRRDARLVVGRGGHGRAQGYGRVAVRLHGGDRPPVRHAARARRRPGGGARPPGRRPRGGRAGASCTAWPTACRWSWP